ncbi:PhzF family phenazine biosynthesis protein [Rickettsiella endosymbiont of Xylota segnis]|uniref:PhzF family phenazine biosynthesis protein n=1 Tax=Rickettsiella endosymbiont of Xylota segnis TaxID=3066238 RepID=UPI0030D5F2FC
MDVNTINVFSINNQGGNPCVIVDNANNLSVEKMQIMATHFNFPETVYIIRNKNRYIIRYFATKGELPLCCHGTLAAAFYLFKSNSPKPINIQSYQDRHKINVRYANNLISMSIPNHGKILTTNIDFSLISKLLDIDQVYLDKNLPCAIASIGSPKLLIPIINREILFDLLPKLDLIIQWCKNHCVNGIYAYSKDTENTNSSFVGRSFNPLFSHQEDIATGVAAAGLSVLISQSKRELESNYIIEQGSNLQKASKIYISIKKKNIEIKGEAYFSN